MLRDFATCSDAELLAFFSSGGKEALEFICERHFIRLVNKAFQRLGSKEAAKETVQDIFVQLHARKDAMGPAENFTDFLDTLLRNKIIERYCERLTGENKMVEPRDVQPVDGNNIIDRATVGNAPGKNFKTLIDTLPHKCREVFLTNSQSKS